MFACVSETRKLIDRIGFGVWLKNGEFIFLIPIYYTNTGSGIRDSGTWLSFPDDLDGGGIASSWWLGFR